MKQYVVPQLQLISLRAHERIGASTCNCSGTESQTTIPELYKLCESGAIAVFSYS
jgi:hypothetical protein